MSKRVKWLPVAAAVIGLAAAGRLGSAAPAAPAYLSNFPNFNPAVTPSLPGDVDTAMKKSLEAKQQFAQVQRLFDLWSWQAFITLNSPSGNGPEWMAWAPSQTIFLDNGAKPASCPTTGLRAMAVSNLAATVPAVKGMKPFFMPPPPNLKANTLGVRTIKLLFLGNITAVGELAPNESFEEIKEIKQAFTGPLVDQNGNFVFYEIRIDPNEAGYICENGLYNINGQVAFTKAKKKVDLPEGKDGADGSGAWELKLAWRILTKADDASRYLVSQAIVPEVNGKCPEGTQTLHAPDGADNTMRTECLGAVGLVGMHIAHKTQSSPQWIWSTFEQIDNLAVDNITHPTLRPSFFNPGCPICAVNQQPQQNPDGTYVMTPTQVSRAVPIPPDKVALNREAEAALAKSHSPLAYYQLIDSQWPTNPSAKPSNPALGLPNAIENKSGGDPTPVFLTNITMETYFQTGNQAACNQEENVTCPPVAWQSEKQVSRPIGDTTPVFGSESCMGCHSSAGLYTSYDPAHPKDATQSGQLTADFSWLFSQKASYAPTPPK